MDIFFEIKVIPIGRPAPKHLPNVTISGFKLYFLWIANYNKVESPLANVNWKMWQFSDNGSVNGIKGPVDLDLFKGSFSELKKYALK